MSYLKKAHIIFYLACLLLFLQSIIHPVLVAPQCAQHMSAAWHIADGLKFGVDFLDDASPLFLYLLCPFVFVANLIHVNPLLLFKLGVLALTVLSGRLCFSLLESKSLRYRLLERQMLSYLPLYMVLFLLFSLPQSGHSAQLLLLGVTPYLVLKCAQANPSIYSLANLERSQLWQVVLYAALTVLADPQLLAFYLLIDLAQRRFFLTFPLLFALAFLPFVLLMGDTLNGYIDSVLPVLWLNFKYFNDYLYWMDKSPDLRQLVYLFVLSATLTVPLLSRSALARLLSALSCLGFTYFIVSVGMLSEFSLPMLYFSIFPGFCGLLYFLFSSPCKIFQRRLLTRYTMILAAFFLVLACFSLKFKGSDLSIFSSTVIGQSLPGDTVAFYNWQSRPAFPLTMQLTRRSSNMPCFYPFTALHHGDVEGSEGDRARLKSLGDRAFAIVEKEISGSKPPTLIFVEDGDLRQEMTERGLLTKIESRYSLIGAASFMSEEEQSRHEPFEYLGFRNGFAVFRLNN